MLKNMIPYRVLEQDQMSLSLSQENTFDELLDIALAKNSYQEIQDSQASRTGWVPYLEDGPDYLYKASSFRVLRLKSVRRHLPKSAVDELVADRCAAQVDMMGYPPGRREKMAIKERVVEELMPRAFPIAQFVTVWWHDSGVIIIDAGSAKKAEAALDFLRETLGSLKVVPISPQTPAGRTMTTWLNDAKTRPNGVTMGDVVKLRSKGDDGVLSAKHIDPDGDEVRIALEVGRQVTMLELNVEERARFNLGEDFIFKNVRFADAIISESDRSAEENELLSVVADTNIFGHEAFALVGSMLHHLGGEASHVFQETPA